jgi:hypothetical protein
MRPTGRHANAENPFIHAVESECGSRQLFFAPFEAGLKLIRAHDFELNSGVSYGFLMRFSRHKAHPLPSL